MANLGRHVLAGPAQEKFDILCAHKAFALTPGLSSGARQVGAWLIEFFNRKSGRCDPSQGTLAKLIGCDVRTVRRGVKELQAAGLFVVTMHGGGDHRSFYAPNWPKLRELADEADRLRQVKWAESHLSVTSNAEPNRTILSGSSGQECPVTPDENVRQYQVTNQLKKCGKDAKEESSPEDALSQATNALRAARLNGSGRGARGKASANNGAPRPAPPHRSPSRGEAAHEAAGKRIDRQLANLRKGNKALYEAVIAFTTPALDDEAVAAEVAQSGAGYPLILQRFQLAEMAQ